MAEMFRPMAPGDLVQTSDGYHGILVEPGPEADTWIVATGNGLEVLYPSEALAAVPLHAGSPCPSSFSELLRRVRPRPGRR